MEVLNISTDNNEGDTSADELEEDPDYNPAYWSSQAQNHQREQRISREVISSGAEFSKLFQGWERPVPEDGTLLYSSSPREAQPDKFRFLFLDSVSSISSIKHPGIELDFVEQKDMPWNTVMRLFGVARVPEYLSSQDLFDEPDFMDSKNFNYFEGVEFLDMINSLRSVLNERVSSVILQDLSLVNVHDFITENYSPVVRIEGLPLGKAENAIFHFPTSRSRSKETLVLKIYVALPMFVSVTAKILDEFRAPCEFQNFETSITNNIRFLADKNIPGCTWLELKAGKYFQRIDTQDLRQESHCQIELDVHYKNIITVKEQPEDIPPLRILSFDLECRLVEKGKQPIGKGINSSISQVIQIGAVVSTYGARDSVIIGKAIFVLGTCDALPDTKVVQFYDKDNPNDNSEENLIESEVLMLASFRDFIIQMDPDIITGYNIKKFDLPYLLERTEKFHHQFEDIKRFGFLGRLKKVKASSRRIINKTKRMYAYDEIIVNIQGRIVMDMFPLYWVHDTKNCGRYSLNLKSVSKRYLKAGDEKDDVKYTEINSLQNGDSKTRKRLAKYCVQDAYLPLKLMMVQMPGRAAAPPQDFLEHYYEKSRMGGTIIRYLLNKSREYDKYFKHVRVQKNDGRVKYHPDSPSPKKLPHPNADIADDSSNTGDKTRPPLKSKKCNRMLFTDDD